MMMMMMRIPHTGVLILAAAALLAAAAGSLEGLAVSATVTLTTATATTTTPRRRVLKSGKTGPPPPPPPKSKTVKSSKKNPSRPTPAPAPAPTPAPEQCRTEGQTCVDCPNFCCTVYKKVYPYPNTFPNYWENYVTECSAESGTCEFVPPVMNCGEYEVQCDKTILELGVPCAPLECVECTDVLVDGGVNCIPNPAGMSTNAAYFTVDTVPLEGNDDVTSKHTTLFVPQWQGNLANKVVVPSDVVCFVGGANGLAPNIASVHGGDGTDCSAKNGCGVHVHSGTSCDTAETQGGHWYNTETLSEDPWKIIGYKETNAEGDGQYAACVRTGYNDLMRDPSQLAGHVFILHAEDGSRVSCGVIQYGSPNQVVKLETSLDVIPSPDDESNTLGYNLMVGRAGLDELPGGEVTVLQNKAGLAVADGVCYLGFARGLEPDVVSYLVENGGQQCNVPNGCGAHIHSGTGCADAESQGGHYYDRDTLPVDPWQLESYYTTDTRGTAALIGCTITGTDATDYPTKPFIVHGTDGGRKLCGVLGGGGAPPVMNCGEYEVQCDESILALGVPCAPLECVECTNVLVDGGVNCIPNPDAPTVAPTEAPTDVPSDAPTVPATLSPVAETSSVVSGLAAPQKILSVDMFADTLDTRIDILLFIYSEISCSVESSAIQYAASDPVCTDAFTADQLTGPFCYSFQTTISPPIPDVGNCPVNAVAEIVAGTLEQGYDVIGPVADIAVQVAPTNAPTSGGPTSAPTSGGPTTATEGPPGSTSTDYPSPTSTYCDENIGQISPRCPRGKFCTFESYGSYGDCEECPSEYGLCFGVTNLRGVEDCQETCFPPPPPPFDGPGGPGGGGRKRP